LKHCANRRSILLGAAAFPLLSACATWGGATRADAAAQRQLSLIENELDGRLGLFACATADGRRLDYRSDERFALCSTFKLMLAAAILKMSEQQAGLLQQVLSYRPDQLVEYSPITARHVDAGMSVAGLCAAALQYSDNTAGNLLIERLGGLAAVTEFARSLGDRQFRLDRWETALNSAIPGDPRDTTTPAAMGDSLRRLVLGDALAPAQRAQLCAWLGGNTTGAARIKAGIPASWTIVDKTGGGSYGTANDIAVLWPPQRSPVVVAIYTTRRAPAAPPRNELIAAVARVVVDWLG
jgi:beta-lactamase class A